MSIAHQWREMTVKVQQQIPAPFVGRGTAGQHGASGVLRAFVNCDGGVEFSVSGQQMNHAMYSVNDRDLADFGAWLVRTYGS